MWRIASDATDHVNIRPVPSALLSRHPSYPGVLDGPAKKDERITSDSAAQPPIPCGRPNAGKENLPDAVFYCAEEMRCAPNLGHRGAQRRDSNSGATRRRVVNASVELEELEKILMYVECVTESLVHRARAQKPPDNLMTVQSSVVAPCRVTTELNQEGSTPYSIALCLHDSSNRLLSWCSKLQYVLLPSSITLQDVDKSLTSAANDVRATLDSIEQRYKCHEVADVREFFHGSCQTLDGCRRVVAVLLEDARELLIIRRTVAAREFGRTRELFSGMNQRKRLQGQNKSSKDSDMAQQNCPYLAWLENKWLPAMAVWDKILIAAHKQAVSGDVDTAIARAHMDAVSQSSILSEILLPNESLTEFLRDNLVAPLSKMEENFKRKKHYLDRLRTAMSIPRLKDISECICALGELLTEGELSVSERALYKEGKKLIIQLQQVENIESSLRLTAQVGETVTLFRTIHQANIVMLQLGIAGDTSANESVVKRCAALLEEIESTRGISASDFIARRVDPAAISVAHVPSLLWTTTMTAAYQAACQRFNARIAQDLSRLELERAMDTSSEDATHYNKTMSSPGEETSTPSNTTSGVGDLKYVRKNYQMPAAKVQELRATLELARQVGLTGSAMQQGEARLRQVEALKIKVHFEAQLRIMRLVNPEQLTFECIYNKLHDLCMEQAAILPRPSGQRLRIRYQDNDGDCISLVTQEDWNAYVAEFAPDGLHGAKLELYCDFPPLPKPQDVEFRLASRSPPQHVDNSAEVADETLLKSPVNFNPAFNPLDTTSMSLNLHASSLDSTAKTAEGITMAMTAENLAQKNLVDALRLEHSTPVPTFSSRDMAEAPNCVQLTRSRSAGIGVRGAYKRIASYPLRGSLDDSVLQNRVVNACSNGSLMTKVSTTPIKTHSKQQNENSPSAQGQSPAQAHAAVLSPVSGKTIADKRAPVASRRRHALPVRFVPQRAQDAVQLTARLVRDKAPPSVRPQRGQKKPFSDASPAGVDLCGARKWDDDKDTQLELQTVASVASGIQRSRTMWTPPESQRWFEEKTHTMPPASSGEVMGQAENASSARTWSDNVVTPLDLQTVASVPSVTPRAAPAERIPARQINAKSTNIFTVTGTRSHGQIRAVTPIHRRMQGQNSSIRTGGPLEEKRGWSADVCRTSDIHSIVSEITVAPSPGKGGKQQTKPTTTPGTAIVESISSSNNVVDAKKKMESLRQLKELREENQRALKAVLHQRRLGKS